LGRKRIRLWITSPIVYRHLRWRMILLLCSTDPYFR